MINYKDLNVINHKFTNFLHQQPYRVCSKTIMDTSDIYITFDSEGVSNHFYIYQNFKKNFLDSDPHQMLMDAVKKIKLRRQSSQYDCILGISGGR